VIAADSGAVNVATTAGSYDSKDWSPGLKGVSVSSLSLGGSSANDYNLTTANLSGSVGQIDKANLTITANNQKRAANTANPVLSYSVNGFKLNDDINVVNNFALTTNAIISSPAGAYSIYNVYPYGPTALNYVVTVNNGWLTVFPGSNPRQDEVEQQAAINAAIQIQKTANNTTQRKQETNQKLGSGVEPSSAGRTSELPSSLVEVQTERTAYTLQSQNENAVEPANGGEILYAGQQLTSKPGGGIVSEPTFLSADTTLTMPAVNKDIYLAAIKQPNIRKEDVNTNYSGYKDAIDYYNRGNMLSVQGRYNDAIYNYSQAIRARDKLPQAYCNRGWAYAKEQNFEAAISDYTNAISVKSGYAQAYFNRGVALNELGENEQALADFRKAVLLDKKLLNRLPLAIKSRL
jgi:hypothetical protein